MHIVTPTHIDQLPSALNDPSGNLLRPAQMMEHMKDIQIAKAQLENPNVQDKGAVRQRLQSLNKQYESQAPRPITNGAVKDALRKETDRLLEKIIPGMLSHEEMRKNPPGSVDKHMRWERTNKKDIMQVKKNLCALNADSSDPHTWDRDAANLERFRPQGPQDRFRADAQITGKMTYGGVPEENWTQTFGTAHPETSALNQAKRAASADPLRDLISESQLVSDGPEIDMDARPSTPAKRTMSAEQRKKVAENFARGREAKKLRLQEKGA